MATELNFNKTGSRYECVLNPTGPVVVEVMRAEKTDFTVYGYIGDMEPVPLFSTGILADLLFQVDVPEGVTVRMVSESPVESARQIDA